MITNPTPKRRPRRTAIRLLICLLGGVVLPMQNVEAGVLFFDDFETDQGWRTFEEIVVPNCYGDGIGEAAAADEYATSGSRSLRVWANKELSDKSNHVIAGYKLANPQLVTGRVRYELDALIDPATAHHGQTGPEFSLQRTQFLTQHGDYRTMVGGIQFIPNPYLPRGSWNIWTEQSPGVAGWQDLAGFDHHLSSGRWYHFALEVDFAENKYVSMTISGDGVDETIDLSGYDIAEEIRFRENAFWLTLESENIWNNCGTEGNHDFEVHYDDATLHSVIVPEPPAIVLLLAAVVGMTARKWTRGTGNAVEASRPN